MKYLTPEEGRTKRGNLRYLDELTRLARKNRKKMTQGEVLIWDLLKKNQMGFKFLKQKPVGRFIIDFYCSKLLLAIEIDGGYHDKRQNYDNGRDELLFTRGIRTMRIKEEEVLKDIFIIKDRVKKEIEVRSRELNCSPLSRGAPGGRGV